jgi:hypothetical protein
VLLGAIMLPAIAVKRPSAKAIKPTIQISFRIFRSLLVLVQYIVA